MDFLLPRKFRVKEAEEGKVPPLGDLLKQRGFEWRTQSLESPPVEVYVKEISGHSLALEFLTDRKSRSAKDSNVSIAGISAQPLTYIEMSLGHAEVFHTKSDAVGLVVSPGAWIFHKALTFVKRKTEAKKAKDLTASAPADWERLESQDPSGTLSRQRFVAVVSAEFD